MKHSILVIVAVFGLVAVCGTTIANSASTDVATSQPLEIMGRVEINNGQTWLVLESPEAVLSLTLERRSKRKLDVVAFGKNVSTERIMYDPTAIRVAFIVDGVEVPGVAMTPDQWAKKQKTAALWRSMAVGLANGMNQQQNSVTTTYSGSNGYSTATTKESRRAAQQRAVNKSVADGQRINAQAEAAAADVAQLETLSPGEIAGGAIHLERAPKGATELILELPLGSGVYKARWPLG